MKLSNYIEKESDFIKIDSNEKSGLLILSYKKES